MADTISNRSDFNVEQLADVDANSVTRRNPGDEMDAERVRRAVRELEQVRDGLTEPERSQLSARIDSIQTQLASGVSPAQLLAVAVASARTEAQGYAQTEAVKTQAAIYEGIALSAEAQARVNYRMNALEQGNYADYYFSSFDRENLFSDATKTQLGAMIQGDPAIQQEGARAARLPEEARRTAEGRKAADEQWLDEQIAQETNPEIRQKLEEARRLGLVHDRSDARDFRTAVESGNAQAIEDVINKSVHDHAEELRAGGRLAPNSQSYNILMQNEAFRTADGYSLDYDKVVRYNMEHRQEIAAALNKQNAGQPLSQEERQLVQVGQVMALANTEFSINRTSMRAMHAIAEHQPEVFERIMDTNTPATERAQLLAGVLKEQGARGSDSRILADATSYVRIFDTNPNARNDVLANDRTSFSQKYGQEFESNYISMGLQGMGYSAEQIDTIRSKATSSPELSQILTNSFAAGYRQNTVLSTTQQKALFDNVLTNGGPENQTALSVLNYYNLDDRYEGSQLRNAIMLNEISPQDAALQAESLRRSTIQRMEAISPLVPAVVSDQYIDRVKNIEGMTNADGSLNVDRIIEQARVNRDSHGQMTDQQMRNLTNQDFNSLSDEQKDARALARVAAHYKAVDMIQTFGAEINNAYARNDVTNEVASPALRADLELYAQMTNAEGRYTEQQQRQALDTFLSREQYYKNTNDLREELTTFVVDVSKSYPELLNSYQFTEIQSAVGAAGPQQPSAPINIDDFRSSGTTQPAPAIVLTQPDPITIIGADALIPIKPIDVSGLITELPTLTIEPTAEQRRAMANEGVRNSGDATFENAIEDRIKKAIKGKEMSEVVATFGALLGEYNVGNRDNVTHHEIENALAAKGFTKYEQLDKNGDKKLSIEEITAALGAAPAAPAVEAAAAPTAAPAAASPATPAPATETPAAPAAAVAAAAPTVITGGETVVGNEVPPPVATPTAQQDPTKTVAPAR